jgi:WhiB family transcriptional regulator, redox-sensing transcriptional regulator
MLTCCPSDEFSLDTLPKESRDELPCRVQDADLWFAEAPTELERAKAFCQACPVRTACLLSALERREPWGVWGGEIFDGGTVIARKRPRGRPRKHPTHEVAA